MNRKFEILLIGFLGFMICVPVIFIYLAIETTKDIHDMKEYMVPFEKIIYQKQIVDIPVIKPIIVEKPVYIYRDGHGNEVPVTEEEITMLVNLVWFESGNQDELGRRYVVDTVLNRVRSKYFPNTIKEVISQHVGESYQYGVVKRLNAGESHYLKENEKIVQEEIMNITNKQVIYFQRGGYHSCGTPVIQHGDHYFSGLRAGL